MRPCRQPQTGRDCTTRTACCLRTCWSRCSSPCAAPTPCRPCKPSCADCAKPTRRTSMAPGAGARARPIPSPLSERVLLSSSGGGSRTAAALAATWSAIGTASRLRSRRATGPCWRQSGSASSALRDWRRRATFVSVSSPWGDASSCPSLLHGRHTAGASIPAPPRPGSTRSSSHASSRPSSRASACLGRPLGSGSCCARWWRTALRARRSSTLATSAGGFWGSWTATWRRRTRSPGRRSGPTARTRRCPCSGCRHPRRQSRSPWIAPACTARAW
mmetsp:Transcript_78303/g.247480  ORF Transcript_78303/g.247480 Transcript_78303/m.247480 type:complete len:275 (+) Transcript_78303:64-888(+)